MSKNISISDDVYQHLKREKTNGKSFSDVIAEHFDREKRIIDVVGANVLDPDTFRSVKEDITEMSTGTVERMQHESS